jgi:hypothetical protein
MITQLKQDKGRALLLAGLSAGFLLLHMEPAKASVAPLTRISHRVALVAKSERCFDEGFSDEVIGSLFSK